MDQKCLIWLFLVKNLKKLLSCFKSTPSSLINCKVSYKNKQLKIETKMNYFGYFWTRILKNYCHISNHHFQTWLIRNSCKKIKIAKNCKKNVLFVYFWSRTWKNYCHILNRHPQIWLLAKFHKKTKRAKNWIKKAVFFVFLV